MVQNIIDFQGTEGKPSIGKNIILPEYDEKIEAGGGTIEVVQTTGESTTAVMSQAAVTEAIATSIGTVEDDLATLISGNGAE